MVIDGAEKNKTDKMKYVYYFTKARRNKLKNDARKQYIEDIYVDTKEMENI